MVLNEGFSKKIIEAALSSESGYEMAVKLSDDTFAPYYRNPIADMYRQIFLQVFTRKGLKTWRELFALEREILREIERHYDVGWREAESIYNDGTRSLSDFVIEIYGEEYERLYQRTLSMTMFGFYEKLWENIVKNEHAKRA